MRTNLSLPLVTVGALLFLKSSNWIIIVIQIAFVFKNIADIPFKIIAQMIWLKINNNSVINGSEILHQKSNRISKMGVHAFKTKGLHLFTAFTLQETCSFLHISICSESMSLPFISVRTSFTSAAKCLCTLDNSFSTCFFKSGSQKLALHFFWKLRECKYQIQRIFCDKHVFLADEWQ